MHEINDISLCSATAENKMERKIIAGQLHAIRSLDMFIACGFSNVAVVAVFVAIASPHEKSFNEHCELDSFLKSSTSPVTII